ncbi:GH3 domain-containing protein-like [Paramacrobiotus metropolitanus]|uniref:GH3 domain-containing protein-like n=1 Tax=Paramacrobiotus metropolitanus TaxID=2943436 RepID=UPI0024457B3C|nr:GH3 domain-containing protein-like [Paramacrobiotus metropolitanus]
MNLWPDRVPMNYLLFPYGIFYEFIPLANVHDTVPPTLFMDQLEKGQDYEIVLTTRAGLYRYRLGDIVRVVDFFQQCPVIEFQYRSGQLLNIKAEKVSEVVMLDAIKQAVDSLDVKVERIVDFTACESLTRDAAELGKDVSISSVPCYVVFLELTITGAVNLKEVQLALADKVDERLAHNHSDYKLYRSKGAIGPLELYLLKPASFVRMRNYMLDNSGSSPSQLKMPRVLRKPELVKFIWGERV